MDSPFLLALSVTVTVETAVLLAGLRLLLARRRPSLPRVLFAGVFASSWSLPYFWFLVPRLIPGAAYLPAGESLVIIGEAVVFCFVFELPRVQCLVLSALCNLSSFVAGLVLLRVLE